MIYFFYLASGNSKRFSSVNKLLIDFEGKPLFCHGLDMLCEVLKQRNDCKVVIVSRYDEILQYANNKGLQSVYCAESVKGLSYSIKAGLKIVDDISNSDFISFVVADQPFLRSATIIDLLNKITPKTQVLSLAHGEKFGNPKIFSGKFLKDFLELTGDDGGKSIIKNNEISTVQVGSSLELKDVDSSDYLSDISNIFITGTKKVGKSTLINEVLEELNINCSGYVTLPEKSYKDGNTYRMHELNTENSAPISKFEDYRFKPIESIFENFGKKCVEKALNSCEKVVLLDEIGRFERNCTAFLNSLEMAFNSEKTVIAVLKKEEITHIQRYKYRSDSILIDLDIVPYNEAKKQLIYFLDKIRQVQNTLAVKSEW